MNMKGGVRGRRVFGGIVLVLVLIQLGACRSERRGKDFITWDDIQLGEDGAGLSTRDGSKVIVVDQYGGGDSLTVQGAIDIVPDHNTQRVKIFILAGEKVVVPKTKPYISFIGDERRVYDTVITWNNKASDTDENGAQLGTYRSASVTIESDYFCATGITFQNTVVAQPGATGMQAVALRVSGDMAFFYRARILGSQDTLLDQRGSHYYYQCYIEGNIDFIFGRGRSLFKNCNLHSTAQSSGAIAAHHRDSPDDDTGFSFVDCEITGTGNIFLGRAWGDYSRIIYANSDIDNIIIPDGWSDWDLPYRQKTAVFSEYSCRGRGANTGGRVSWRKIFTYEEVKPFLSMEFIEGDQWLKL
ncbi:hypothetical protein K2173_023797 [Erythroxylum novogranatense]|uniref:pectinesterase n=1 Tax=Erythroxylum novogranatense TaxID=1862640 RepID=A0AAV8TJU1_9ROSI|nr:hypothetical protein K2173_023797 [Erythroxylum novogranatense]